MQRLEKFNSKTNLNSFWIQYKLNKENEKITITTNIKIFFIHKNSNKITVIPLANIKTISLFKINFFEIECKIFSLKEKLKFI